MKLRGLCIPQATDIFAKLLEVKNNARRNAEIVLRFAAGCRFREAGQEIFDLSGPPGETMRKFHVDAASKRRGEGVVRAAHTETTSTRVCNTK